jgi:hypothetical protein
MLRDEELVQLAQTLLEWTATDDRPITWTSLSDQTYQHATADYVIVLDKEELRDHSTPFFRLTVKTADADLVEGELRPESQEGKDGRELRHLLLDLFDAASTHSRTETLDSVLDSIKAEREAR